MPSSGRVSPLLRGWKAPWGSLTPFRVASDQQLSPRLPGPGPTALQAIELSDGRKARVPLAEVTLHTGLHSPPA